MISTPPDGAARPAVGAPTMGHDPHQGQPPAPHRQLGRQHCHLLLQGLQVPQRHLLSIPKEEELHFVQDIDAEHIQQLQIQVDNPWTILGQGCFQDIKLIIQGYEFQVLQGTH